MHSFLRPSCFFRFFIITCSLMAVLSSYAEEPPAWYDLKVRRTRYPREVYFSGFVLGEQQPGENLQQAMERIKREAQVEAASSIRMKVEKTLTESNRSELVQEAGSFDERVTEHFESSTQIRVDMEIPGLKVEVWKNDATKELAAFAYVKKDELVHTLERQILTGTTKAELTLENVSRLIEEHRKPEARKAAEAGMRLFEDIEKTQALLSAVDNRNAIDLQISETNKLKQSMADRLAELQHGIAICLRVKAYCQEKPFSYLEKQLQGELNALSCHFTKDTVEAEWIITIDAKSREYQRINFGNTDMFTFYMDAQLSVFKTSTEKLIYEDLLTVKGTHTLNFDEAAREAYKAGAKKIGSVITQTIMQ